MVDLILTLPWPPSANKCWRNVNGGTILSKEARAYRSAVEPLVYTLDPETRRSLPLLRSLAISIKAYPPDKRKRDLDNLLKPTLDALEHAGFFENDNQIDHLTVSRKEPTKAGFLGVSIQEIDG